jgi:dienelactone hydrolase
MSEQPENRLTRETSPYLLQHRDNPVHWWAWGQEALAEAKRTEKPILVLASGVNRVNEKRLSELAGEPVGKADADFVFKFFIYNFHCFFCEDFVFRKVIFHHITL